MPDIAAHAKETTRCCSFYTRVSLRGAHLGVPGRYMTATNATCADTPNWENTYELTCASFSVDFCSGGSPLPGKETYMGQQFGFPEENCCACGKGKSGGAGEGGDPGKCTSRQGFRDVWGSCLEYASNKWCEDGDVGSGWQAAWGALGAAARGACCACGGGDSLNRSKCAVCAPGSITDTLAAAGAHTCTKCAPGQYSNALGCNQQPTRAGP